MGGYKTLFLFAGLLAIVGFIYFYSGHISQSQMSSLGKSLGSSGNLKIPGQVLGAETVKNALGGVDSLIAQTEAVIKKGAANLVQSVSNSAVNQITGAILGSSTPAAMTEVQVSQPSAENAGGVSICPAFSRGQAVTYVLKFTTSSQGKSYAVDWGDGVVSTGNSVAGVSVSHIYSNSGSYTITLKSGTVQIQKDICVE